MKCLASTLYTAFSFVLPFWFANDSTAATLFCTVRSAPIYVVEDGDMRQRAELPSEILVVGTRQAQYRNQRYHYVRFVAPSYEPGWICETELREFRKVIEEETASDDVPQGKDEEDALPWVIRQQRSPTLKRAWVSLQPLIEQNVSLPEDKRVPEPYFARAEVWMAVHDYPRALRDYLTALRYASSTGRELHTYARYHPKVETVINRFTLVPAPPAGGSSNPGETGEYHFSLGVTSFRQSEYVEAIHHFDNAVSLVPDNPLYWYYRSVASKRSGDLNQAMYDALYGAFVERKKSPSYYSRRRITRGLEQIQGKDRAWLESFRLGDPSGRILKSALEDTGAQDSSPSSQSSWQSPRTLEGHPQ